MKSKGFTLIELLVVVAIVAILIAIISPIGGRLFGKKMIVDGTIVSAGQPNNYRGRTVSPTVSVQISGETEDQVISVPVSHVPKGVSLRNGSHVRVEVKKFRNTYYGICLVKP